MSWSPTDLLKIFELKTRYFFGLWVFGALLIFIPLEIKQQMGVDVPKSVQPWLGFSTLAFFVFWIVQIFIQTLAKIKNWFTIRKRKSDALSQLETLSRGERDIFIQCLADNKRTIHRNITDGAANGLKQKRLLLMASQGSVLSMPHTIPKFIWDHIKSNEATLFPELYDDAAMRDFEQRQRHGWMLN